MWRGLSVLLIASVSGGAPAANTGAERWSAFEAAYTRSEARVSCLSLARVEHVEVVDEQHLLFRVAGRESYLNTLPRPCRALNHQLGVSIDSRTARLCDIDWVRVLRASARPLGIARGPACGLGKFERVYRAGQDASAAALTGAEGRP
jgi:hypothetical protein